MNSIRPMDKGAVEQWAVAAREHAKARAHALGIDAPSIVTEAVTETAQLRAVASALGVEMRTEEYGGARLHRLEPFAGVEFVHYC